ncbi:aldo/keto reductase [Mycolicibacterium peregrinum]|uniref:Aldo/keto reductase n=1 Tax=Mycolicibacterium peregrinum TaxID=43304 RepID=A0A1A0RE48_MYCPR|nr:aldo/keto reductase [Mycolicibacterium peregrinum]OBB32602.1 aldo/keto reductase [Mycolicibacterium peregrinum]
MTTSHPGGTGTIGGHSVARIGYGAMGLGHVLPQADATAVLHRAVELGVNHIDTASFYDDGVVNGRIRDALAPYRDDLLIVSKVGARPASGPIPLALAQHPADLRHAVELDLTGLGLDQIPVVNLRRADLGPGLVAEGDQIVDLDDQLAEMVALRDEGKIGAIGISNVDLDTLRRALPAGIVCVQNAYSLINRTHEDELTLCSEQDIAWVPFFPLGSAFPGFPKVAENAVVQRIAADLGVSGAQVGLAWLLAHAPNTLLIAGTTSIAHLEENLAAGDLMLTEQQLADLDAVHAELPQGDGVQAFLDEGR